MKKEKLFKCYCDDTDLSIPHIVDESHDTKGNKQKIEYRVTICKNTGKKIVQVQDGNNWICLHKDNEMLDMVSVDAFETGQGKKVAR